MRGEYIDDHLVYKGKHRLAWLVIGAAALAAAHLLNTIPLLKNHPLATAPLAIPLVFVAWHGLWIGITGRASDPD
jgi:hypothetical protein